MAGRGTGKTHLGVIRSTSGEQRLERIVSGDQETGEVDEELASDVKEDKEEVDSHQRQDGIDLGDRGLSLQVEQDGVLGELWRGDVSQEATHLLDLYSW